jgi:hypothetical protein
LYTPTQQKSPGAGGFDLSYLYAEKPFEVWPENWRAVEMLGRLATQWRTSFSGFTGLDYNVLFTVMEREGMEGEEWDQFFSDMRVLEAAALEQMARNRE